MKKILTTIVIMFISAIVFAYSSGAPSGDELILKAESVCSSFRPLGMAACGAKGPLQFDGRQGIYDRYRVQCFCTRKAGGELSVPGIRAIVLWDRNNNRWAGR